MKKIPNTFGIDVTAARFLEYGSEDELRELIAAGQVVAPWLHIGGGSNLLFIKDYEGTVLHSRIGGLEVWYGTILWPTVWSGIGMVPRTFR